MRKFINEVTYVCIKVYVFKFYVLPFLKFDKVPESYLASLFLVQDIVQSIPPVLSLLPPHLFSKLLQPTANLAPLEPWGHALVTPHT